jgi:hypothetical protein
MNGLFPLVALYGLITKNQTWFGWLNIYSNKYWGWTFSVYSGIITNIWIIVQQLLAEYFILQTIIAAVGLLIVVLSLMPRVQKYFTV